MQELQLRGYLLDLNRDCKEDTLKKNTFNSDIQDKRDMGRLNIICDKRYEYHTNKEV